MEKVAFLGIKNAKHFFCSKISINLHLNIVSFLYVKYVKQLVQVFRKASGVEKKMKWTIKGLSFPSEGKDGIIRKRHRR